MAKEKRAFDDLDAELAALEAELAALEGKKPAAKPKKAEKPKEAPAPAPEHAPPAAPPAAEKKGRFQLPGKKEKPAPSAEPTAAKPKLALPFGKKRAEAEPSAAAPAPAPQSVAVVEPLEAPTPEKLAVAPALARTYDATVWRHEGDAWVRAVPGHEPRYVRRILDENGATVREEPATKSDADEVAGVKAERGIGRLFGRKRQ